MLLPLHKPYVYTLISFQLKVQGGRLRGNLVTCSACVASDADHVGFLFMAVALSAGVCGFDARVRDSLGPFFIFKLSDPQSMKRSETNICTADNCIKHMIL